MRGRLNDIATSRAFIPPWSLAVSSMRRIDGQTGLLSDQPSRDVAHRATGTLATLKMMQTASHLSRGVKARTVPVRRIRLAPAAGGGSRSVRATRRRGGAQRMGHDAPRADRTHRLGAAHQADARRAPADVALSNTAYRRAPVWARGDVVAHCGCSKHRLAYFSLYWPPRGAEKPHLRDARVPVRENDWSESSPALAGAIARRAEGCYTAGQKPGRSVMAATIVPLLDRRSPCIRRNRSCH